MRAFKEYKFVIICFLLGVSLSLLGSRYAYSSSASNGIQKEQNGFAQVLAWVDDSLRTFQVNITNMLANNTADHGGLSTGNSADGINDNNKGNRNNDQESNRDIKGQISNDSSSENNGVNDSQQGLPNNQPASQVPANQSRNLTVLLVGVDERPGENDLGNTDTLILANINSQAGRLALLSIPRDTMIQIPGYGVQKINAVARLEKGLPSTVSEIQKLTGVPINGYIKTNFAGFKEIVDTLGGITVNVEKDMYYNTGDKQDNIIDLKKGVQRLNGTQALQYVRFRHDKLGDISRVARQQEFLKATAREFMQVKTLPKLPWLIPQVYRAVKTDLNISELWNIATLLVNYQKTQVVSQTLPGDFAMEKGISYWKVNPKLCQKAVRQFIEEGKTSSVFFGSLNANDHDSDSITAITP